MSPVVTQITFPSWMPTGATNIGHISFSDHDLDVSSIQFDVADGRYEQVILDVNEMASANMEMTFSLRCTSFAQQITLAATLIDSQGSQSTPHEITFTCGNPAIYNFDAEQNEVNEVDEYIPLNIFVLDDGVSSLAYGAVETTQPGLSIARAEVLQDVRDQVIPYLTGIWDQCGLGFELVNVWVVDPDQVELSHGSLASQLFTTHESRQVIMHGANTGNVLRQGVFKMWRGATQLSEEAERAFNVMLVGVPILVENDNGSYSESEGFSHSLWPNYAVSRLGTLIEGIVPKQMISTLAHELGHNLGLNHPGEDDLYDTVGDHINLMRGSGVTPQPRANLLASQCAQATEFYAELQERISLSVDQTPAENQDATVTWSNLCADGICSGEVELSVEAEGFESLDNFSFASFEYSLDGERFFEIAVDRSYQEGFSVLWDTTALANGPYTIRAVVTDSKGVSATVEAEITIQN